MLNSQDVLSRYLAHLNIYVSPETIGEALINHPQKNSVYGMVDVLDKFNIQSKTLMTTNGEVDDLMKSFITYLPFNNGEFVFVEKEEDHFFISNASYARLGLPVSDFARIFSGLVFLIEKNKHSKSEASNVKLNTEEKYRDTLSLPPSFLIIGAQKAGTTALFDYLNQHPNFKAPLQKEVHFFDLNYNRGLSWYSAQFPKQDQATDFTGEASPYYLYHPCACQRVLEYAPGMKIISILRDPVERAYSQYQMNVAAGYETLSFEQAITSESRRIAGEHELILTKSNYNSFNHQRFSYLDRGKYCVQLLEWMKVFKKENLLILSANDLRNNPQGTLDTFCDFINVSHFNLSEIVNSHSRVYDSINPSIKAQLKDYFKPFNEALLELTGIDFLST